MLRTASGLPCDAHTMHTINMGHNKFVIGWRSALVTGIVHVRYN
jgi:hypothetical protein